MPKKLPSCSDFIVAAIRATRPTPKNLKPGTSACRGLRLIYSLANQYYSEQQFRRSIDALISSGVILLIARVCERGKREGGEGSYGPTVTERIFSIPPRVPLNEHRWVLNGEGKPVGRAAEEQEKYLKSFHSINLYVVADGLPQRIAKLVSSGNRTKADEIIASLQKKS